MAQPCCASWTLQLNALILTRRSSMANFLLLLHQTPGRFRNLSPEEIQKILGSYIAWREALVKRNKMRAGEKLTDDGGRHLRTHDGMVSVTGGPYSESPGSLGGVLI